MPHEGVSCLVRVSPTLPAVADIYLVRPRAARLEDVAFCHEVPCCVHHRHLAAHPRSHLLLRP